MKFPFKEKGEIEYEDICPFTVFASLIKELKNSSRMLLLKQYAKQFL